MRRIFLLSLLIISAFCGQSQTLLTIDDAISIALKNNYDILIARNEADIAKINNSLGNAGMLPTAGISASNNFAINNVNQKLASGVETSRSNTHSNTLSAGAFVNWTLFDGGKMFIAKNRLKEIQTLGELQYQDKVAQTVFNVIAAYYDVARQTQQLNSFIEVVNYNTERVKILQASYASGLISKNNLLQSKIDLNVYSASVINQKSNIIATQRALNLLLCRDANTPFAVSDSIPTNFVLNKEELIKSLFSKNTSILSLQKEIDISKLGIKEYKTQFLPKLSFNGGYNFYENNNSFGNIQTNRITGPQFIGSLSVPLYQSGNVRRQINVAKLQLKSSEYNLESVKIEINIQLQNAISVYEDQLQLLAIEKENAELTRENLEITMERLRLGQTTALEVRQAQESFVASQTRLINLKYNLKIAETKLKQLIAGL